ncbi:hypothetical protein ACP90_25510 [Labrenzia sp. CP4]|nr:hypothetical protein ACP90_25510 [Labrenzia sp. CP4]ERP97189.1 hypothetical protein Q669_24730 [Labrenzia sp. C1B10]ERS09130.1 hypothetical protein Q675_17125 [Labrenzia sp. C1B70]
MTFSFVLLLTKRQKRSSILGREDPNSFRQESDVSGARDVIRCPTQLGALQQAQALHKRHVTKLQ